MAVYRSKQRAWFYEPGSISDATDSRSYHCPDRTDCTLLTRLKDPKDATLEGRFFHARGDQPE